MVRNPEVIHRNGKSPCRGQLQDYTRFIQNAPTTGLHFQDIAQLLGALRKLIQNGGSALILCEPGITTDIGSYRLGISPDKRSPSEHPIRQLASRRRRRTDPVRGGTGLRSSFINLNVTFGYTLTVRPLPGKSTAHCS